MIRTILITLTLLLGASSEGTTSMTTLTSASAYTAALQNKNDMTWSGSDQMSSIVINGRRYWFAGDTIVSNGEALDGSYPPGTTMIGNRILLQVDDRFTNAMANNGMGIPNPPTRTSENNERYWAISGVWANGYLYVTAARVRNDPTWGWIGIGTELAKYSVDPFTGKLTLISMITTPSTSVTTGPGASHIQWGNAFHMYNNYVYIYGSTNAKDNPYVINFSYVAMVHASKLEVPSAWRYYKKTTGAWVSTINQLSQDDVNQPDAILPSQVSDAAFVGGKMYLSHKPWAAWGSDVFIETSTTPYGPWTQHKVFSSPEGTWEGIAYVTYGPMMHPEVALASGSNKLLMSINWAAKNWGDAFKNADLGKPRFYEVTKP